MVDNELLLKESDPKFKEFIVLLNNEFERVRKNIAGIEVNNDQIIPNNVYVTTPNLFSNFGQFDVEKFHPELISKLNDLLIIKNFPINLYFDIDFSFYGLEIKNLYDKLFELTFPIYLFWNSNLIKKVLEAINEWRSSSKTGEMSVDIIVPLIGFYLPIDENDRGFYENILLNNDRTKLLLKSTPNFSVINYRFNENLKKVEFIFEGISDFITRYIIQAKGKIPFKLQEFKPDYSYCYLWQYIKQVAQGISLEGTLLRFGTPFYILPWWFSNEIKTRLNFHHPDWMSDKYMTKGYYYGLVPDIEPYHMTSFRKMMEYYEIGRPIWESDLIHVFGTPLDSDTELYNELFNDKTHISNPEKIGSLFNQLSDNQSALNFFKDSFILDRFLRLSQRNNIEDIILDTCVILESVFLSGIRDELSYRLKLNISSILAKNLDEFSQNFEYISELYDFRSAIVHGTPKTKKSKKKKKSPYQQFVQACYPDYKDLYILDDFLLMGKLDRIIQYDIFERISQILCNIIELHINFKKDFENIGFLNIFLNKE